MKVEAQESSSSPSSSYLDIPSLVLASKLLTTGLTAKGRTIEFSEDLTRNAKKQKASPPSIEIIIPEEPHS